MPFVILVILRRVSIEGLPWKPHVVYRVNDSSKNAHERRFAPKGFMTALIGPLTSYAEVGL